MLLPSKSAGSEYTAAEWTQIKDELEAAIQGSGMTLSASILTQLRESMMRNVTAGRDCVVGGTANAITLTTRSPFSAGKPAVYQAGATYSALITTPNTSATTVNINGLGLLDVKKNAYADQLVAGDIVAGLYDFVIDAGLTEVELVAKKASFASSDSAPWTEEVEKLVDYTILPADAGKLFYVGSAVTIDIVFTVDPTFPDDGVVWISNRSNNFVGGGLSGSPVVLTPYDGTLFYANQFFGDGIKRVTKSSLTGELEFGNG